MPDALNAPSNHTTASWSHWLLRIAIAGVFLYTGVDKFAGSGIQGFAQVMGLPFLIALAAALGEIAAGVLVLLGGLIKGDFGSLVTRLAGLIAVCILLGAIFMEHWGQWHFMASATHPLGGMMFQVTLALMALYLVAKGNEV
ncbi:DoxX family protein [Halomonas sp. 18H]|nr:DoxX family protein [Halomonas sp. 18H]MCW4152142.1 DoxX family protein [Halomonas sp. 18H]